jgi:hypothetical protein
MTIGAARDAACITKGRWYLFDKRKGEEKLFAFSDHPLKE